MTFRLGGRTAWFVTTVVALGLTNGPGSRPALAAGTVGQAGAAITATFGQPDPTPPKPEHRLWYAANVWWGIQPSSTHTGYTIWKLEPSGTWTDTGVVIDRRSDSGADALFNGKHLFVATHQFAPTYASSSRAPATLLRFTYVNGAWKPDKGFPVPLTDISMPALSIGQDSTGRIVAAYVSSAHPWYLVTEIDADSTIFPVKFGNPVRLAWTGTGPDPDAASTLTGDDIAAVNSSNGFTTIVWSNQSHDPAHNGFYAARHRDATPFRTATWTAFSVTTPGENSADNHIALASITGDTKGRVFGVLKTSKNDAARKTPSDPQLLFTVFTPTDQADKLAGTWRSIRLTSVGQGGTRPAVVIDRSLNRARVFYAAPYNAGTITAVHNQGVIFEKQVDFERVATSTGRGTVIQRDPAHDLLDDPTTTAQNTDAASGTVVASYLPGAGSDLPGAGSGPGRLWHSGAPGAATFGTIPTATTTTLAFPVRPPAGATVPPTFGSRAKDLASTMWGLVWGTVSGTPGRYIALGVATLSLVIPTITSARRRAARRRRRAARQRYGYY